MLSKLFKHPFSTSSQLLTWGKTTYGWGRPTSDKYYSPDFVPNFGDVKKVSTGEYHLGFITSTNSVYTVGWGKGFRLGHNNQEDAEQPKRVQFGSQTKIVDVKCGSKHTLALSENGEVYAWGYKCAVQNQNPLSKDQQGKTINFAKTPTLIDPSYFNNHKIVAIGAGNQLSVAVDDQGTLYAWGSNTKHISPTTFATPSAVDQINDSLKRKHTKILKFFAIDRFLMILADNGRIYAIGKNNEGVFATRKNELIMTDLSQDMLTKIVDTSFEGERIVDFECSSNSLIFLVESGRILFSGMRFKFKPASFPIDVKAKKIFATQQSVGVIGQDNKVYFINDQIIEDSDYINGETKVFVSEDPKFDREVVEIGGAYHLKYALVK